MITVIIPTYNRIDCMRLIVNDYISKYHGNLFLFEIHDSSNSNEVESLCLNAARVSGVNISYFKYESCTPMDDKLLAAIKNVKTEYLYIGADGYVVDFNELEEILIESDFTRYNVIDVEAKYRRGVLGFDKECASDRIIEVDDSGVYCERYYSHLTCWGSQLIRTDFYNTFINSNNIDKYRLDEVSFWVTSGIFESIDYYLDKKETVNLGVLYTDCISSNPYKKGHSWTRGESYFIIAIKVLNKDIDMLPSRFDDVKEKAIDNFRRDALARRSFLMKKRIDNDLHYRDVRKYKSEIKRIKGYYLKFLVFSIIPPKILSVYWNMRMYSYSGRKNK